MVGQKIVTDGMRSYPVAMRELDKLRRSADEEAVIGRGVGPECLQLQIGVQPSCPRI